MTTPYTPVWLVPSAPGQLSNKRGSNTGADAISLKTQFLNPLATGDKAGTIRVQATRTVFNSVALATPQTAWDSGWAGTPAFTALPATPVNSELSSSGVFSTTFNRVYFWLPGSPANQIYSASATGSCGTWRPEQLPAGVPGNSVGCLAIVEPTGWTPRLYVHTNSLSGVWFANINPDGTLGAWTKLNAQPGTTLAGMISYGAGDNQFLFVIHQLGSGQNTTEVITLDKASGQNIAAQPTWTAGPTNTNGRQLFGGPLFLFNNGAIYIAGGDDAVNAKADIIQLPVNTTTWVLGSWAIAGTGLPAARSYGAFGVSNGYAYYVGGGTLAGGGTPQTQIWYVLAANIGASAWTTSARVTPSTLVGIPPLLTAANAAQTSGNVYFMTVSGNIAGSLSPTVWGFQCSGATGDVLVTPLSGVAPGLTAGNLGTGGVLANNLDGTQNWTFLYNAFGQAAALAGLSDGDQIQVSVQFTDLNGDPSPVPLTLIKIGQPPTISGVTWSDVSGKPTLQWNYLAGAGGGPEAQWQCTVAAPGPSQVFDSGVHYDQANNVLVAIAAVMLLSGTVYTPTITVKSTDIPISGGSNSATATTPTTTPSYAAIVAPTGITAVPNNAQGSMTVGWTNPGGSPATGNRVYYRRTGTSTWYLLADNQPTGTIGSPTSQIYLDELALGVAYDFNVTAITATGESGLPGSPATNVKIDPVAGGYTSMLHIQGNGITYQTALKVQATPRITTKLDAQNMEVFGLQASLIRYGIFDYRSLELPTFITDTPTLKTLQNIIQQVLTGTPLYYRDAFGVMLLCSLQAEQADEYRGIYRYPTLRLIEVSNQYSPSTSVGSANGYRQQVNGTLVPLDISEVAL